ITAANYEAQYALDEQRTAESAAVSAVALPAPSESHRPAGPSLADPDDTPLSGELTAATRQRIALVGERLLEYLLFRDEAELKGPVKGSSAFTEEFQQAGPRDSKGRSLRQLDLTRRLLKHPCSFLIYTDSFDALPKEMRDYLWMRLEQILTGED